MTRDGLLQRLHTLQERCEGCTLPPHKRASTTRVLWCQEHCQVAQKMLKIGPQLDKVAKREKKERARQKKLLPACHLLANKKGLTPQRQTLTGVSKKSRLKNILR